MFFIIPTNKPIKVTCSKCGREFIQRETRTCTSLNNFIHICQKCRIKYKLQGLNIFKWFNFNKKDK